ncbi:MAG: hypothetical protein VX759_05140 [SAR324 cluster bacterium]|nr:hypothetical protein [SAR324 cluster bacterium]
MHYERSMIHYEHFMIHYEHLMIHYERLKSGQEGFPRPKKSAEGRRDAEAQKRAEFPEKQSPKKHEIWPERGRQTTVWAHTLWKCRRGLPDAPGSLRTSQNA